MLLIKCKIGNYTYMASLAAFTFGSAVHLNRESLAGSVTLNHSERRWRGRTGELNDSVKRTLSNSSKPETG